MCSVQQSRDGEEVIRHRTWGAAVVGAESRPLPRLGRAGWGGGLGSPDPRVRGPGGTAGRSLGSCEMGSGRGHGALRWEWGGDRKGQLAGRRVGPGPGGHTSACWRSPQF